MATEIAVYTGKDGKTVSLEEPGTVTVYRRRQGEWIVLREKQFCLDKALGLRGLRDKMGDVLGFLNGCRVFVAQAVAGVPYYELEKVGCSVWELEGKPLDLLDYVLNQEEKIPEQEEEQKSSGPAAPVETSPGCYRISISDIQTGNSGVTSKQALLPFLRRGAFYSLEVICSHVPPWLEAELLTGDLCGKIEKTKPEESRVIIIKRVCT